MFYVSGKSVKTYEATVGAEKKDEVRLFYIHNIVPLFT